MEIIDTHCHVYPKLSYLLKENEILIPGPLIPIIDKIKQLENTNKFYKKMAYEALKPLINSMQNLQTKFNDDSGKFLTLKDQLFRLGSMTTILSSTVDDLLSEMNHNNISKTFLIAHPPLISNDFVLELSSKNNRFIPIVNIPEKIQSPEKLLDSYLKRGAVALKIHAAADGMNPKDSHYHRLLHHANSLGLPVIIHTGALKIEPLYKNSDFGHAEYFENWFSTYKKSNFILAHMNIHFPEVAMNLCSKYKNVYTDTSWQNEDTILKAINLIGSKKILFGTDWPIMGNNIELCINRIHSLYEQKKIKKSDYDHILNKNAKKIFNL